MVFILGASSLDRAIKSLPYGVYQKISVRTFTCPGLSLNERAKNRHKILQNLLGCGSLRHTKNLIIWHDIINNTLISHDISKHSSNDYRPCPIPKLIEILKLLKPRIAAVFYCQRLGTDNILKNLQKTLS